MDLRIIKRITNYAILFSLLFVFATSCEMDDPITPPDNTLHPDSISNLAELRDLFSEDTVFFENSGLNVFATVTMDDNAGNIYREAFVQDDSAGILLRLTQFANFKEGDSVRIALNGAYITQFAGMLQLSNLNPATNVVVQESDKHLEPTLSSIGKIDSSYQGMLVKIDDVQFAYGNFGVPYALSPEIQSGTNRRIQDEDGNTMIVRTSGYADFASELTPEGNGSIIGLVGEHFGNMQLHIRRTSEVNMEGERFETIDPDGEGTFDDPYNVAHAIAYNTGTSKWVEGYIVGVMETVTEDFHASFEPPFQTATNIIIADTPDETSLNNAIIVQILPGDIRSALNLVDNPENKGKVVKLLGDLGAYFGQPGLLRTSGYWMDGEGIIPTISFWEATFSNEADGVAPFTDYNVLGEQNWYWAHFDGGCVVINGFVGGAPRANENWLISPEIDLSGRTQVSMEIREAINFITSYNDMQVLVATDYENGNPNNSGNWTLLEGFDRPQGDSWNFSDSGSIDLSEFENETIHIAFRYISTTSGAAAWEISEVRLFEAESK